MSMSHRAGFGPASLQTLLIRMVLASCLGQRRAARRAKLPNTWWRQTGSNRRPHACKARALPAELCPQTMVGLGRLERPTSPLSGVRSNHLSYRPEASPRRSYDHAAGQRLILREERETRAAKSRIRDPDLGPIVPSESRGQARWTVAEDSSLERR